MKKKKVVMKKWMFQDTKELAGNGIGIAIC